MGVEVNVVKVGVVGGELHIVNVEVVSGVVKGRQAFGGGILSSSGAKCGGVNWGAQKLCP